MKIHELPSKYRKQIATQLRFDDEASSAVMECSSWNGTLATPKVKASDTGRFLVNVTSYRRRLLDEDNLSEKYFCDLCRYAGIIPDDTPDRTQIKVSQIKVTSKEEEKTVVEVYYL
jgi:hypothetical protein